MNASKIIKLSANENFFGCSPKVYTAIENHYRKVYEYPEMNPITLKEKIAGKHKVNTNNIIVGPGSVSLINHIIQAFSKPGEEIVTFEKSFIAYGQLSQMHGRKCVFAPMDNLRCTPDKLLPLINSNTKVIFIANPNNPTGTIISHKELVYLLENISPEIIVVHDEAYSEYVHDPSFPDAIEIQNKYRNLIVLHSFSKIYGLAGLRVGYAVGSENMISALAKIHVPYSLNYLSSCATIAALEDEEFVKISADSNEKEAIYLFEALKKEGYYTVRSHANFVYVWFNSDENKKEAYNKLIKAGIVICDLIIFGQELSLRITIGNNETNRKIIAALSN